MGAAHGPTAPVLNRIQRDIRQYSLFQGVLLVLERLQLAHPHLEDEAVYERLQFIANPSMGFPGCDIEGVEFIQDTDGLRARLQVNMVSLSGAGSPLPAFYGEQALGDGPDGNPTREFLDLFNDRLQRLLLPIWQKYRYRARFTKGAKDSLSVHLLSLVGLRSERMEKSPDINWKRLLPYLGVLSMRVQSAELIESILRYYFKHPAMQIEQCMERRVAIPAAQRCQLGQANSELGMDLVLGEDVFDRSGKFRLHIRELDWDGFHSFLPPGQYFQPLRSLVRFTLRDPLDYDIQLHLRPDEIRELRLGASNPCRLGWTSWLGHEHAMPSVTLGNGTH